MLFSLGFGCVVAETFGYRSSSANAPTLASLGNSCRETAGSCVVGSPEWGRTALDEVHDVRQEVLTGMVVSKRDMQKEAPKTYQAKVFEEFKDKGKERSFCKYWQD